MSNPKATHQSPYWDQTPNRRAKVAKKKKWIQGAIKKPGALHKALGVSPKRKLSPGELMIKSGDTTLMKRRKNLARTLRGLKKRG